MLTLEPALQCEADAWLVVNDENAGQQQLQNYQEEKSERVFVVNEHPSNQHFELLTRNAPFGNSRGTIRS